MGQRPYSFRCYLATGEHEASRRLKTELMVQTEGCGLAEGGRILLVGATNRPEELDEAARHVPGLTHSALCKQTRE